MTKMTDFANTLVGLKEVPGAKNNPTIMKWAKELGLKAYNADSIPWCGLFMAWVAHKTGKKVPENPLWARNWLKFGVEAHPPMFGDVLVFGREGGGHVGLYWGEDATAYHVLGGNQGDKVSVTRILKSRLLGARRPEYKVQPADVKIVKRNMKGGLSTNEK